MTPEPSAPSAPPGHAHAPITSVVGLYGAVEDAERAARALEAAGVPPRDVQLDVPTPRAPEYAVERRSKAPEGAIAGAGAGGALGLVVGFVGGSGAFVVPGLGFLLAAGPILAALSSAAVGAAVCGAIGALVGWRIPELEALPRAPENDAAPHAVLSVRCRSAEQLEHVRAVVEAHPHVGVTVSEESEAPAPPPP